MLKNILYHDKNMFFYFYFFYLSIFINNFTLSRSKIYPAAYCRDVSTLSLCYQNPILVRLKVEADLVCPAA